MRHADDGDQQSDSDCDSSLRIMLIAPEPVANDEGGSDDVLTPIKVGSANPTPRPIGSMPKVAARKLGSRPGTTDHQTCPRANEIIPRRKPQRCRIGL
jgi:hypothetical protein